MTTPRQIGKYRILNEIASGAQGAVYRGFDPSTSTTVAVKVLHLLRHLKKGRGGRGVGHRDAERDAVEPRGRCCARVVVDGGGNRPPRDAAPVHGLTVGPVELQRLPPVDVVENVVENWKPAEI